SRGMDLVLLLCSHWDSLTVIHQLRPASSLESRQFCIDVDVSTLECARRPTWLMVDGVLAPYTALSSRALSFCLRVFAFATSREENVMHHKAFLAAVAAVLAGLVALQAQPKAEQSSEEQSIRESDERYCVAFDRGDIDSLLSMWADDADYVDL